MADKRVFEVDLGDVVTGIYSPLLRAQGISGRGTVRVARVTRNAIRQALTDTIIRAYRDGAAPHRTGRTRLKLLGGVRAQGSTLISLKGWIVGPSYVEAHEEGATITPKRAKALAIPLAPALRADGSPKLPGPNSWRNVLGTFIYKSRTTGQAYIAYKNSSGNLTLLYVLVDSATLSKYKGFLSRSWDREKNSIMIAIGNAMLFEMSQVDLLSLARVTYRGRSTRR